MDHKTLFPVLEMGFLFFKISGDQLHEVFICRCNAYSDVFFIPGILSGSRNTPYKCGPGRFHLNCRFERNHDFNRYGVSWISESKGKFTGGTGKFEGISGTVTIKVEGTGPNYYVSSKWEVEYEIASNSN